MLAPAAAAAEAGFDFATTPGKLPKHVVPVHYALALAPDLDKLTFAGAATIDIDVKAPTATLVLNALDLRIEAAAVTGEDAPIIALDAPAQTVTLTFPRPLAIGRHQLRMTYTGRINRFGRGLYMVDYPTGDGTRRMLSSQLEPTDARRIFPGWDEPAFKATFALTVTVPQAFLAVSNMPIAREEPAADGTKQVAFQPTPPMSSYLFVLAAGDLERITADAGGVTVGVVATRGKAAHGRYALELRCRTAALLQRLFRCRLSAAQARSHRSAGRIWRCDGELGRHHVLRKPPAVRPGHNRAWGAARHLRHHRP